MGAGRIGDGQVVQVTENECVCSMHMNVRRSVFAHTFRGLLHKLEEVGEGVGRGWRRWLYSGCDRIMYLLYKSEKDDLYTTVASPSSR